MHPFFFKYKFTLFLIFTLGFNILSFAQEIKVIDNKGTIDTVRNNTVITSNSSPQSPVEGDIWFDTNTSPSTCKLWDGSTWLTLNVGGDVTGSLENETVVAIQNIDVSPTPPTDGQLMVYDATNAQWQPTSTAMVYTGFFIINAPGGTNTSTNSQVITGLPFKPSQITFVAHANVESLNINASNSNGNNSNFLSNSFGTMNGFARIINGAKTQQFIYVGGSGNSINNISRYSSDSDCIGIRYGNQNGQDLGRITSSLTSFDSNGFTISTTHTLGTVGNNNQKRQILNEALVVLYTAYR